MFLGVANALYAIEQQGQYTHSASTMMQCYMTYGTNYLI